MLNHNHGGGNYSAHNIDGTAGDDVLVHTAPGMPSVRGGAGDDVLTVRAHEGHGRSQLHAVGDAGDDTTRLDFGKINAFSFGHHARGDEFAAPQVEVQARQTGRDTFNFVNLHNVKDTVQGRIDDIDWSRDKLQIGGRDLDMSNLPSNMRLVAYNGNIGDPGSHEPQTWLHIKTSGGGDVFYAIDGARVDMTSGPSEGGQQEPHFITKLQDIDLDSLPEVAFVDPINYIPAGHEPDGGARIGDLDVRIEDVRAPIEGTDRGDLIGAGLNDDRVEAGGGADRIWGGSGDDTLYGEGGNDVIVGGAGDDVAGGGSQNDVLYGAGGDDELRGGAGDDELRGGPGRDVLNGGTGSDVVFGGNGADRFVYRAGGGLDIVEDFDPDMDVLDVGAAGHSAVIEDGDDLLAFMRRLENDGRGDTDTIVTPKADVVLRFDDEAALVLRGAADDFTATELARASVDYEGFALG